jgi:hypothetical protein
MLEYFSTVLHNFPTLLPLCAHSVPTLDHSSIYVCMRHMRTAGYLYIRLITLSSASVHYIEIALTIYAHMLQRGFSTSV